MALAGKVCSAPSTKTWAECNALAILSRTAYFTLEGPHESRDVVRARCCMLPAEDLARLPVSGHLRRTDCNDADGKDVKLAHIERMKLDHMGHSMGSLSVAAVYAAAQEENRTYLNDVWLWRYPQLPWQPVVNRDGTPRRDAGSSPPN